MKNIVLSIILFLSIKGYTQNPNAVNYKYDLAGNRYDREPCMNCRMIHNNSNGPNSSGSIDTLVTLADIQVAMAHGANVFPNPTQDKITIYLSNLKDDEPTSVIVTDESGQTVYTQKNLGAQNEINMSSFNVGTYFVRVLMGNDVLIYKVLRIQ